jgi:BRCT domain type II-containing protein
MSLYGKTICFTGTLQRKRDDARLEAINAGAMVSGTVTETTNILVCGSGVGAKKPNDAEKKGVEVWTEEQFTSALSGVSSSSKKQAAAGGSSSSSAQAAKKGKTADAQHPIDASGVLQAVKDGSFAMFEALLESQKKLFFEDFNSLPQGRNFGVVHQKATQPRRRTS